MPDAAQTVESFGRYCICTFESAPRHSSTLFHHHKGSMYFMKALYERWTAISLPKRILGGMILGAVLGMVIPQAVGISILGNLFVNALKGIAPLPVFFTQTHFSTVCPGVIVCPCSYFSLLSVPSARQSRATAASSAPLSAFTCSTHCSAL